MNRTVIIFNEEFVEGTGNWIKCKASDIAGNEVISEPVQIFIDISPPVYDKVTPSTDTWSTSSDITADITFMDNVTGLDPDSIEYRLKWSGEGFGKWIKYTKADSGKQIDASVKLAFIEGENNVIQWRIADIIGNQLVTPYFTIKIDLTEVTFSNPLPVNDDWHRDNKILCGITIDDTGGSGVDTSSVQYRISDDGIDNYGLWKYIKVDDDLGVITINQPRSFPEGSENYIQWRAKDMAGNGYTSSDSYNLKVDVTPVTFSEPIPDPIKILVSQELTAGITITDHISGIDTRTVEYSLKNNIDSDWSNWTGITLKDLKDQTSIDVSADIILPSSRNNFIRWHASDTAGNELISDPFIIQIDSPPVAVLRSPGNGEEFLPSQTIIFDGTQSYDPDRIDTLTYSWISNLAGILGTDSSISKQLIRGEHTIEFTVSDQYGLSDTIRVNVIITEISVKAELSDDTLSPGSGTTETEFTFSVHYHDSNDEAPDSVMVVIDGFEHEMNLKEGENVSDGIYEYKTRLSKGTHLYYFTSETVNNVPVSGKALTPTDPDFAKSTPEVTEPAIGLGALGNWALIIVIIPIVIILSLLFILFRKRGLPSISRGERPKASASTPQAGTPPITPQIPQTGTPAPFPPVPLQYQQQPIQPGQAPIPMPSPSQVQYLPQAIYDQPQHPSQALQQPQPAQPQQYDYK